MVRCSCGKEVVSSGSFFVSDKCPACLKKQMEAEARLFFGGMVDNGPDNS